MCFSASASLVAGAGLSAVGVATLKKTKKKSEIPFASIPLLFGIQQAVEGVVWLTFSYSLPLIHTIATYAYAIFAYVWWPIFVPFAIGQLETVPWRKKALSMLQILGLIVGAYLLYFIAKSTVTSAVVRDSIVYEFYHPFGYLSLVLYLIAGCLGCFISSHRMVNLFGILLVLSLFITYQFYSTYIVSIWCFFAAILSVVVYLYFTRAPKKSHDNAQ